MKEDKVYCEVCERLVIPSRLNFKHIYHELLCFMIFLTWGLGFFIYLAIKYSKKKIYCPHCESKLINK